MNAGPHETGDGPPSGGIKGDPPFKDADTPEQSPGPASDPEESSDPDDDSGPPEPDDDSGPPEPATDPEKPPELDDIPRILLFMRPGRNRELLTAALSERYAVETTTDVETLESTFDCCVFDAHEFTRVAGTIQPRRALAAPVFLPFVLLVGDDTAPMRDHAWEHVDDIVELPVRKRALRSRIANLVERRRTSLRLAERERRLTETVADLRLKERAMDEAPVGITVAESGEGENPLVYTNHGFETLTGYGSEMFGADCRFLQGTETDPDTRAEIRAALDEEQPISTDILNYRRNGQTFWNRLTIAPLRDEHDEVTHYVGFQTDITDRKIRERRLEVMGRVLNHNLRNKMNLIDGYAELLRSTVDDEASQEPLDIISETADDLMRIAETVRKIDHALAETPSADSATDLTERLPELVSRMSDRYPDATFSLSLPDASLDVTVVGLVTAIEEAVENAVKHNDRTEPTVAVRVERRGPEWIAIEIEDDGPGIPDHEVHVLGHGETNLTHADRLGIWLMYWVVNKAGGEFSVSADDGGTTIGLSVPIDP
ncbi:PAS domain-containing protein [Halorubrum sp. DTA46]|uniref:PAS domain-containing protein n=1 Tax=Halorubrum sp. DTA46 TaxID=3402162 RepID=UPI003AAFC7F8